jgi:hypothetical protein
VLAKCSGRSEQLVTTPNKCRAPQTSPFLSNCASHLSTTNISADFIRKQPQRLSYWHEEDEEEGFRN